MNLSIRVYCSKQSGIEFLQAHPRYTNFCMARRWSVSIQHSWDEIGCSFRFAAKPTRKQIKWAIREYKKSVRIVK